MNDKLKVRKSVEGDTDAVYRLLCVIADVHKKGRPDMFSDLVSKYTAEEVRARLSKDENGVFVAEINGSVVGYIFCEIIKEGKGLTLYIDDLCVEPEARRCGIATALMDHACAYGKEKGCQCLMLNVWEFNRSALDFYKKYGFTTRTRHLEMQL